MPDIILSSTVPYNEKGKEVLVERASCQGRTGEQLRSFLFWQPRDTVPGSGGSWPGAAWEQMEYGMFFSGITASKGKAKQNTVRLRSVLPDRHFLHSAPSRALSGPQRYPHWLQMDLIWSPKEEEKPWSMAEISLASWRCGDAQSLPRAMCVYRMLPFLGSPSRHVPPSSNQWKDLKYGLICIYLTENITILPEDLWVK